MREAVQQVEMHQPFGLVKSRSWEVAEKGSDLPEHVVQGRVKRCQSPQMELLPNGNVCSSCLVNASLASIC